MANNTVLYGFRNLTDVFNNQVNDAMIPVITTAIEESVAAHNEEINAVMSLLAEDAPSEKEFFKTPTTARLQPLDEGGRARPVRPTGGYDVAFPIKKAGIAEGNTYEASVMQTVADVQEVTAMMLHADNNWMMDQLLAACYNNADWTFFDPKNGNLTIKPVANGDGQKYFTNGGAETGTTQNNLLGQVASIGDANNALKTAAKQLRKFPGDRRQIITLVPTNLINDVMGLSSFIDAPDENIRLGADVDVLSGGPGVAYPGTLRGYERVSRSWIVEWERMADSRFFMVPVSGPRPIGMRQYSDARLRGFTFLGNRDNLPYYERQYARWAGFGARNRTALVGMQIGSASWSIPSGFDPAKMG